LIAASTRDLILAWAEPVRSTETVKPHEPATQPRLCQELFVEAEGNWGTLFDRDAAFSVRLQRFEQ